MELHPEYEPPAEQTIAPIPEPEYVPPPGFVDYWDWARMADDPSGVATGRLAPWLRNLARLRDPLAMLIQSAAMRARGERVESDAAADLAVTGRVAYAAFRTLRVDEAGLIESVSRTNPSLARDRVSAAVSATLDRAFTVAWALKGAPEHRRQLRPGLGWIAVSGEDDAPHTPVNIPCTDDHTGEVSLNVGNGLVVTCRAAIKVRSTPAGVSLPSNYRRVVPDEQMFGSLLSDIRCRHYDKLVAFIHGLGSRLEESDIFKQLIVARAPRCAVLSVDLPGSGYSERLDIDALIRSRSRGHHGFTLPNGQGSNFPLLGLYRDVMVALSRNVKGGIQHAMGGSLGGNLTLWLAEEPMFTSLPADQSRLAGARSFAAWSPASIWQSYERARDVPEGNGTNIDIVKNAAKKRAMQRMSESEADNARRGFFETMQLGENVILGIRSGAWGHPPTKANLLLQSEVYGEAYRRTFWTAAYEQLEFSHQEPLSPPGQWPFRTIQQPLLLASGANDVGDHGVADIYNPVRTVTESSPSVPGKRLLMRNTDHSISDERPQHLASQVGQFVSTERIHLFALLPDHTASGRYQLVANGAWSEAWGSLGGQHLQQLAVGANADGHLELIAVGGDGAIYNRWQQTPSGSWNPEGWGKLGSGPYRQVAVGRNGDGRLQLFALDGSGAVVSRWQRKPNGGWNEEGWGSLGNSSLRSMIVGANFDGRLEVFALDGNGSVQNRWQRTPNGGWNEEGWGSLGGHGLVQIAVGSNLNGRLELFAIGGDGVLYARSQSSPNGGWGSTWHSLENSIAFRSVAVGRNQDGRLELFALDRNGTLRNRWQSAPGSSWNDTGWGSLGGSDLRQFTVVPNADGRLEVFAVGGDGVVYNRWQVEPNRGWNDSGWGRLGQPASTLVGVRTL